MEKLILECAVRSVLIAACAAVALCILRVKIPRVRHAVWTSVVLSMLVLPAWTVWGPKAVLRVLKPAPAVVSPQPVVETTQSDVSVPPVPLRNSWTLRDVAAAVYLLGLFGLLMRLVIGTVRARLLIRRAVDCESRLTSHACVTPITVGWLNPAVILPSGWTQWSQWQLEAVLAHEGEHARRRDPLVQWLALLNRAVFWFHPLAWWLERRLSALAEEACDDAVLSSGHDPVAYSECLLDLARLVRESGMRVSVAGMAMPGTFLPQRIRRIMAGVPVPFVSRGRIICLAVVCALVSTVFTTGAVGYSAMAPATGAQTDDPHKPIRPDNPNSARTTPSAWTTPSRPDNPFRAATVKERLHTPDLRRDVVLIAQAQASPGKVNSATRDQSLWGMVIDPSGKGVAAAVLLTDAGGATRTVNTDSGGVYRFPDVVPGTYSVTVNAPGFKRETQTGVAVAAGETHAMGAMFLQLGSISTSITITGSSSAPVATALPPANGPKTDEERRQFVEQFRLRRDSDGTIRTVTAANLVNPIKPAYPADLQQQGVQGTVKIEAILSKNGVLENIRWINRGEVNESLAMHALDALRQWLYGPTLLNGQPVEVLTMIDVNFELRD